MSDQLPAVIDHDTGELVPATAAMSLFGTDNPKLVRARAAEHAAVLTEVIQDQRLYVNVGQKSHIMVEGWTFLGSMLGVFPVTEGEAEPVEINGVQGFKATVNAQTRAGEIVGRATAYCMRDEKQWASRDTYALASMAQTRATSKALRMPLGFIVTLAGYNATPAEEIPTADRTGSASPPPGLASREQHALLNVLLKELNDKAPIEKGGESWLSALKRWAKEQGWPPSREHWTSSQMWAAIDHVKEWIAQEDIPFEGSEGDSGAAGDRGGTAASPSDGLSASDFKAWREAAGVERGHAANVAAVMFPAKTIQQLTDEDRVRLRDALETELEGATA